MRTFAASLNLLTTALGTWLCIPLVALANSGDVEWVPSDVNEGNLAAFFFLLAGIMLCMTAGFVLQARRYTPVVLVSGEGSELEWCACLLQGGWILLCIKMEKRVIENAA